MRNVTVSERLILAKNHYVFNGQIFLGNKQSFCIPMMFKTFLSGVLEWLLDLWLLCLVKLSISKYIYKRKNSIFRVIKCEGEKRKNDGRMKGKTKNDETWMIFSIVFEIVNCLGRVMIFDIKLNKLIYSFQLL